jgi:propanol-preferring alcohol dehydrogenase
MQAIKLLGNEKTEMVELPQPVTQPGEVTVKIESLALCGSCIKLRYRPSLDESRKLIEELGLECNTGSIPGHEMTGVVVDAHGAESLKEGDRVFIFPFIANKKSVFYRDRLYKYATPLRIIGYTVDGGNTEYLSVPAINCYKLPDYVSFEQGAMLLDPVGAPYGALSRLGVEHSDTVLILGAGPIGLGAVVICDFMNVEKIIAVERVAERAELAEELGAHHVLHGNQKDVYGKLMDLTKGRGPDMVLDCVGDKDSVNLSLSYAAPAGKVGLIGEPGYVSSVPVSDCIIHKDLRIAGSWVYDPESMDDLYALIKDGLKIEKIITHRFHLKDSIRAWDTFNTYKTGKVIIHQ